MSISVSNQWLVLAGCQMLSPSPRLQREEAAGKQEELDRVQRAYEHIKAQEQKLESQLSHISEEVKGTGCTQGLILHYFAPTGRGLGTEMLSSVHIHLGPDVVYQPYYEVLSL